VTATSNRRASLGRRGPQRRVDEHGQTAVLIIGLTVVLVMVVAVVVDATAAYLRRQALDTLADGAALAAADGIQGEHVYTAGLGDRAQVDPDAARERVSAYLASVGAGQRYPGLAHAVEADGEKVVVRLSTPLDLPIPFPHVGDSSHVSAVAAAVTTVGD
jgi:hypothetical protein